MKKYITILLIIGAFTTTNAQFLNFGIKGGVNNNKNGTLRASIGESFEKLKSHKESGYHFGVFSEIKIPFFYIRPELLYTKTESSYNYGSESGDLIIKKVDIPVLLGFKFLEMGRFFAGPSFQYILDTDF
ncbi:MAG: outer membrane beta-barrel protein, partial [Bacteroidota bacterium]